MDFHSYEPVHTCQIPGLAGIYAGVFGLKSDGTFVEVGAYDGVQYSNTYQLAKLGWRGLCIEPDPQHFQKCAENMSLYHVNVINTFVSNYVGKKIVYKKADMTSGDPDYMGAFFGNVAHEEFEANVTTLDVLLSVNYIPEDFDLLVIDVEGHELQVLEGLSLLYEWVPKMIIIETHEYATDERLRMHAKQINEFMDERWYHRIYADTINSIFIQNGSEAI